MVNIIAVHSAHEGTGKTTLTANLAVLLAAEGLQVGILDANLRFAGMHQIFGLPRAALRYTLNDYLLQLCDAADTIHEITPLLAQPVSGRVLLIPASPHSEDYASVIQHGYSIELITDELPQLAENLGLDVLLIDTPAGLNEDTLLALLAISIADTLLVVLRLDQRDYQDTSVIVDVARTLEGAEIAMVVNQVGTHFDLHEVKRQIEQVYQCKGVFVLPYDSEIATLGITGIFTLRYPQHPITQLLRQLARALNRPNARQLP